LAVPEAAAHMKTLPSILLLGDEAVHRKVAADIRAAGMAVAHALQWDEATALRTESRFDLIVIGTVHAKAGLQLCQAVRRQSTIPLILISCDSTETSRVAGFDAGADDCLPQPLSREELLARIRTILRRSNVTAIAADLPVIHFDRWYLNPRRRLVSDQDGKKLALTAAEFDILLTLCLNPGRVMTRAELIGAAYLGLGGPGERSIDVHIRRLRCKIEKSPDQPMLIKTVRLAGYVFTGSVRTDRGS
jgi:two-component system, OmpR family, response regulator